MNNSPTEGEQQTTGLENQPTGQEQVQQTSAEQSNQDANSREQSQGSVSDDTAQQNQQQQQPAGDEGKQTQTQQQGSATQTDDGLAKFAASQGFDLATASDDVKRALKIAHDNQKAFRNKDSGKSISDATSELGDGSVQAEVAQLKYERQTDKFWADDNRDRALESSMVEILNEKKAYMQQELTASLGAEAAEKAAKNYAFQLSRDLDTLYGMAQLKSGVKPNANVDVEAIRREERESINRQLSGGAPQAHATQGGQQQAPKVTDEWIRNEYDPRNPDHIKMMEEAGLR